MMGRVAPPKAYEDDLERFVTADPQGRFPLFETKQKALMFAAAIGKWRAGTRTPVERKGVAIRYDIFERTFDDGYVDALGIAESADLKVLAPERGEERITIFEEYAQLGLREIVDRCFNHPGDPLEALLALAEEARAPQIAGLEGIDEEALRKLMGE